MTKRIKLKKILNNLYVNSFISIGNGDKSTDAISVNEFFNYFHNTDIFKLKVKKICASNYYDLDDQNRFVFKFNFILITVQTDIETISYIAKIIDSISEHDSLLMAVKNNNLNEPSKNDKIM